MHLIWLVLIQIFLISCDSPPPKIPSFDSESWKKDCSCNNRQKYYPILLKHHQLLKGISEKEIISFLGYPNQISLQPRNEKLYKYQIFGNDCCLSISQKTNKRLKNEDNKDNKDNKDNDRIEKKMEQERFLIIKFNAINKVNELMIILSEVD